MPPQKIFIKVLNNIQIQLTKDAFRTSLKINILCHSEELLVPYKAYKC